MQISTSVVWCSDVVVNIHFSLLYFFPLLLLFALFCLNFSLLSEEFYSRWFSIISVKMSWIPGCLKCCSHFKTMTYKLEVQLVFEHSKESETGEFVETEMTLWHLGVKTFLFSFFSSTGKCCQSGENIFHEAPL